MLPALSNKLHIIKIYFLALFLVLTSCSRLSQNEIARNPESESEQISTDKGSLTKERFPPRFTEEAARIAASLSNEQLAAQLILSGIDGNKFLSDDMNILFGEVPAGGIMLFSYNLNSAKNDAKVFLEECRLYVKSVSGVAPFMAVDHEGGDVHRFGERAERLPSAYSFWEEALLNGKEAALGMLGDSVLRSAREIRDLGITMNLAPVVEILNEENSPFLGSRSYGPDSVFAGEASAAFVNSMNVAGVASMLKHFPGSGASDPHYGKDIMETDAVGFAYRVKPFEFAIKNADPSAIMVSHALVPVIDESSIASLSPVIINMIRENLAFERIIVTDDFSMGAVSGITSAEAAVEAIIAGADMVMAWPFNLREIHRAILSAVNENRLSRERLEESAMRIIREKMRYGLMEIP